MNLERYPVEAFDDNKRFEFFSKGPKGIIKKVVLFQKLDKDKYNLAFGDWDKKQRTLDSHIRSNNGDRDKILATVAYSVVEFLNHYEEAEIRIMGQSKGKTRLYQMGINKYLEEINFSYSVSGIEKGILEEFRTGKNYEKFFLSKKRKL